MATMKLLRFGAGLLAVVLGVRAHEEDDGQSLSVGAYSAAQRTILHCEGQIEEYMAQRDATNKAAIAAGYGAFSTPPNLVLSSSPSKQLQDASQKLTLACEEVRAVPKIRNHTCVATPPAMQGPYYHNAGHPIRQELADTEPGVLLLMDIGVIDVRTCQPIPNVLVDVWSANATGHYAGHAYPDSHLVWEGPAGYGPRKGLRTAWSRTNDHEVWGKGAWPTSSDGVSQFSTIYPGYFTGRAPHVHVKIHTAWEPLPNGTFITGGIAHTSQIFFDDAINLVTDKISPYSDNPLKHTWGRTRNTDDSMNIYWDSHANGFGPEFELKKLGATIQQGLIGYITLGIDPSKDYDRSQTQQDATAPHVG